MECPARPRNSKTPCVNSKCLRSNHRLQVRLWWANCALRLCISREEGYLKIEARPSIAWDGRNLYLLYEHQPGRQATANPHMGIAKKGPAETLTSLVMRPTFTLPQLSALPMLTGLREEARRWLQLLIVIPHNSKAHKAPCPIEATPCIFRIQGAGSFHVVRVEARIRVRVVNYLNSLRPSSAGLSLNMDLFQLHPIPSQGSIGKTMFQLGRCRRPCKG